MAKATGIIRKLDELGRVVVPKEIRKKLGICEGSNIEIFVSERGDLVLKKFSPVFSISEVAEALTESLNETLDMCCAICDNEQIVSIRGLSKKDYLNKPLSPETANRYLATKEITQLKNDNIILNVPLINFVNIFPVVTSGFIYGGVVLFSSDEINEKQKIAAKLIANYISKLIN